jgi:aminopeptidase N
VTLSAHETAHQWWYGLVGNDQAMEPWLDETLSTYSELLFYERHYPGEVDWWWNYRVNRFTPKGWVNSTIYDFDAFRPYVNSVYLRGAQFMQKLREQSGNEVFLAFLKDYATRYRHGWVSGADFFNVLGDHTQQNLDSLIGDFFKKS